MSMNGSGEISTKATRGKPDDGFLGIVRAAALIVVVAGAGGSVGLMLWVGHRNPSRVLLVLFAMWDLSPFIGLGLAGIVAKCEGGTRQSTQFAVPHAHPGCIFGSLRHGHGRRQQYSRQQYSG